MAERTDGITRFRLPSTGDGLESRLPVPTDESITARLSCASIALTPDERELWLSERSEQYGAYLRRHCDAAASDEEGRPVQSEKMVEVVVGANGRLVRAGDQCGLGRKR